MGYQTDAEYEVERMSENVSELADAVVGHRIVKAERSDDIPDGWGRSISGFEITLDNGRRVIMQDTGDCCAYTELNRFMRNVNSVDHMITGVSADDDFETWHVYADMGDVLELDVSWSSGNTGYYGFGFHIEVVDA